MAYTATVDIAADSDRTFACAIRCPSYNKYHRRRINAKICVLGLFLPNFCGVSCILEILKLGNYSIMRK